MSLLKETFLAAILVATAASPVLAAEGNIGTDSAYMFNQEGRYTSAKLSQKGMSELMKTARQLPGGVTIVMSKGKLYLVDDPKGTIYQMRMDMAPGN